MRTGMIELIKAAALPKAIEMLLESLFGSTDRIRDEIEQAVKVHLGSHLEARAKKYLSIKTLLKWNTPVPFYDVFYPLKLQYESASKINYKLRTVDTTEIANLFNETNFLTIIGDAGSGKSTLMRHLFINCIRSCFGIPVLIELRNINHEQEPSFETVINEELLKGELIKNKDILKRYLSKGKFVFFLDGFDELKKDSMSKIKHQLYSFIDTYPDNRFVLTSRPNSNVEYLQRFTNCKILTLNDNDVINFIKKQLGEEVKLAEMMISSLSETGKSYIKSFLSNPLLLTIYILTYQRDSSLPESRGVFYRRVFNALFSEHDAKTKEGYVRDKESELSQDRFEYILRVFSYVTYFADEINFDRESVTKIFEERVKPSCGFTFDNNSVINDLLLSVPLWTEDGGILSFAHRSLQEYFTAICISNFTEEKKQALYQKLLEKNMKKYPFDNNFNIILLCSEQDSIYFKKYYHLEFLRRVNMELAKDDDESRANWFIKVAIVHGDEGEMTFSYPNNLSWIPSEFTKFTLIFEKKINTIIHKIMLALQVQFKADFDKIIANSVQFDEEDKMTEDDFIYGDYLVDNFLLKRTINNSTAAKELIVQLNTLINASITKVESELQAKQESDDNLLTLI